MLLGHAPAQYGDACDADVALSLNADSLNMPNVIQPGTCPCSGVCLRLDDEHGLRPEASALGVWAIYVLPEAEKIIPISFTTMACAFLAHVDSGTVRRSF